MKKYVYTVTAELPILGGSDVAIYEEKLIRTSPKRAENSLKRHCIPDKVKVTSIVRTEVEDEYIQALHELERLMDTYTLKPRRQGRKRSLLLQQIIYAAQWLQKLEEA